MKNLVLIIAAVLISSVSLSQSLDEVAFEELQGYPELENPEVYPYFGTPYKNDLSPNGLIYGYDQLLRELNLEDFFKEVHRVLDPQGLSVKITLEDALDYIDDTSAGVLYREFFYFDDVREGYDDFVCIEIRDGFISFLVGYEK